MHCLAPRRGGALGCGHPAANGRRASELSISYNPATRVLHRRKRWHV